MKRGKRKMMLSAAMMLLTALSMDGSPVRLLGVAEDYANRSLELTTYADYVSRMKKPAGVVDVGADGRFDVTLEIEEVTYAFLELSTYTASIYLEPGRTYDIELPPLRVRADADRFNPFYQPERVELAIEGDAGGLNESLRKVDRYYNKAYTESAIRLVRGHDKALAERLMSSIDSVAAATGCKDTYFTQHVEYRKAQVYATPRMQAPRAVLSRYYTGRPVLYNVVSYWETLEMLSVDIFGSSSTTRVSGQMRKALGKSGCTMEDLSEIASKDTLWSRDRTLREAMIVKGIHDNYYARMLTEDKTDSMLTSAATSSEGHRNRLMAANIYAQKNKLRPGLPAPELNLVDENDKRLTLSDFRGKFVYLCFAHTGNYECLRALPALESLQRVHREDLEVVVVFTNEEAKEAMDYVRANNFTWLALPFTSNQKIIFDYEVHGLPTYFLIDPDGFISMSQAPGPTEKVGPAIATAIRSYLMENKGHRDVPRTIYDIANETK